MVRKIIFGSVSLLIIVLIMGLVCVWNDCSEPIDLALAANWQKSTIAGESTDAGLSNSVAVDSLGDLHVSYFDNTNKRLIYGYRADGTWQTEVVAGSVADPQGGGSSIAVDSNDNPCIAFKDQANQDLKYTCQSGNSWPIETVATEDDSGSSPQLALDSNDSPHIAFIYNQFLTYQVRYAYKSGDSWSVETIESGNSFQITNLEINSDDIPVMGYDYRGLYYAARTGGSWSKSVASSSTGITEPTMALRSLRTPHFAYADSTGRDDYFVRYASKSNGSWEIENAASADEGEFGRYSSMEFSESNEPRLVYYGESSGALWYAEKIAGSWSHEVIENSSGKSADLGIDSADKNHVIYYDSTPTLLRYATDSVCVSGVALQIDSGSQYTSDSEVDLDFSYNGAPTKMIIGEQPDLSDATAEPFAEDVSFDLSAGDGEKTVYYRLGNAHGWSEIASQSIIVDYTMPQTEVSLPEGEYADPQTVVLIPEQAGATIYYTIDGTDPDTNSSVYTDPIKINCSTTLKYFCVDRAGNAEETKTREYIIRPQSIVTVPGDPGSVQVRMFNNFGEEKFRPGFYAYGALLRGGANVASGDLNGDGMAEIVVAPEKGGSPQVRIFNYLGEEKFTPGFDAYGEDIRCGVDVATGDLNGDGKDEIITVPGSGCPAQVRIFDFRGDPIFIPGFYAYSPNLRTGFRVAAGDLNGDGKDEIVIVPQERARAYVRIFDYLGQPKFIPGFYAYEDLTPGADVATGDLNNDNKDEIITVPGTGSPAHVRFFNYLGNLVINPGFYAYDKNIKTGFHVASGDFNCDGKSEIITIPRSGAASQVRLFDAEGEPMFTPGFYTYYNWLNAGGDVAVGGIL